MQICGQEIHAIDYYEGDSKPLHHHVDVIRGRSYCPGKHYFPHDIQAHELTVGKSRVETLRGLGVTAEVVPQHHVMDGVNATRALLDKMWIDKDKCARDLQCLQMYAREFDEKNKVFKARPRHDEFSHGADALRTFAAGWHGSTKTRDHERYKRSGRTRTRGWMTA